MLIEGAASPPSGNPLDWWGRATAFAGLARYSTGEAETQAGMWTQRINATAVSGSFFSVLGVGPRLGRTFTRQENTSPAAARLAIVSHRLWESDFGGGPLIAAQAIHLDGRSYAVIGVMPPDFHFPGRTDVWLPRAAASQTAASPEPAVALRHARTVLIGRLRRGATRKLAEAQLNTLLGQLGLLYTGKTGVHFGDSVRVIPLREKITQNFRRSLEALVVAAVFLLLIVCADATNLFIARSASRHRDVAVRLCLGASRKRIVCHAAAEGALLALAGGVLAVLFASVALGALRAAGSHSIVRLAEAHLGGASVIFAFSLAVVIGIILGLVSGLNSIPSTLGAPLKEGGSRPAGSLSGRYRSALVVAELAVALILLAGASLMIQSFFRLTRVNPGFDPSHVTTLELSPRARATKTGVGSSTAGSASAFQSALQAYQLALDLTCAERGVVACGLVNEVPMGGGTGAYLWIDAGGKLAVGDGLYFSASGDYFRAMGIPVLQGRSFNVADTPNSAKVAMVSRTFTQKVLRTANPVGETLTIEGEPFARRVVGLVGDVKAGSLGEPPQAEIYVPYAQPYANGQPLLGATLVVRTSPGVGRTLPSLSRGLRKAAPGLSVFPPRSLRSLLSDSIVPPRFRSLLLGSFAALGAFLALVGVYGVASYATAHRTHEIGVRVALGAQRRDILWLVLRQGIAMAAAGAGLGTAGAILLNRALAGLLFGITPTDPKTLIAAAFFLLASSAAACMVPALRATRVHPAVALRDE